ncbi:tail fiber domain-containing protein [Streptococcus infantis]|uniref:tail fiber domain-containing protein n=1 Tax=Streptococcus infantis TaxID=68892 RepID=UPI0039C04D03
MDIFRRKKFDEAMFAKNRTLAIRVGQYQSSDIKEASFDYGYIKGDTYKPGGTCAGSGKITFTSIITTFNKLDKIYPEIGLLVDGTYEWVKMGEYFINDIEIDRNRKTTKLDLMDGMFKLNREHVTDLSYPAEIRHVIKEICLKTGIELANEYMDITSMNYRIENIPKEKKMTFRDVLSLATQMLGMSCFFNREGKLEITDLTDSGITITADSYFMHGLTKSEIEYQIAGITCKKDKETLTVGLRTGRSLELDNLFMSQSILDNLYHKIKDIRYYPFSLNYQGHLLLDVGQWVTIKTNTGETFKSPVLSQSFNFKGGLRGRISADSKAGNDAQYSYTGTFTKKIEQFNEFEAQIQNQIEEADKDFDQKVDKIKKDFSDQVELAKARAEQVKQELSDTIDQRFSSFDNGPLLDAKRKAEEALRKAGASSSLAQEAQQIGFDAMARLEAFKDQTYITQSTLTGDLDVLKRTVTSEVNQASEYRRTTTEALSRMTGQMNGFATKSEVKQGIDGLTQTFAKMKVGGRNLWIKSKTVGAVIEKLPENHVTGQKECYRLENNSTLTFNIEPDFSSRLYQKITFSAWIKYENVVQGQKSWNAFNCFKHYLFRKNSKTGIQNGPDYTTLGTYDGSSDWKYITFTYDYSENQNFDQLKTLLRFNLEGVTSGTAWVTGIKVEIGSVATDWSLAPEDGENDILVAKTEFKKTADGLSAKMSAVESYVGQDSQRQESLRRYTREESARQATAVRELVARDYVGKATYQEDVRGLERRFEAITNPQNGSIVTQIANYKNSVDGRFADISSLLSGKANQTDFQRVQETSQLYERILGNTENGIADKVARMALTNQLFQVEVGKAFAEHQNLFLNSTLTKGFLGNSGIIYVANATQKEVTSDFISVGPNEKIIFQHWVTLPENGMAWTAWQFFDKNKNPIDNRKTGLNAYKTTVGKQHNINQITVPTNAYFVRFSARMYDDGLIKVEKGSTPSDYSVAPNDALEAVKTVQRQLDGSWSVQNLTSAGSIVSQINATNNQILIEAEKIRLKGKTLLDELTAIQGYFKRLFVGEGTFATLNADVIRTNSITADKLVMDMAMARRFVSSDIFTDTLAAKEAFINKLRSVVVTATLLEGYKGRIGGFQIGTHDKDSSTYWITGQNHFSVGMSNGSGPWNQTALWVNWGNDWGKPSDTAWFVKNTGQMFCYNRAEFWNTPVIHGDLRVTGDIYYNNKESGGGSGYWISSPKYSKIEPSGGSLYLYYSGGGYDWILMNKDVSDRRYKSKIQDSTVSGLDVVENLKTYSYRKEYDGKIEDIACGIMAQDVQKYAPEAFFENPDGAYSYRTFELVPYLIKAIQELNHKIEKLEKTA